MHSGSANTNKHMKIAHTADWHIGKILYRHDLSEELNMFFDWLIDFIKAEGINVLLVSGDVFDLANPSHKDITLFYNTLLRLSELKIKVIITGGNHDSISLLEAPAGILNLLNIHVIGGARENLEEEIIPCYDQEGKIACLVLAVPFLRDKDLRVVLTADQLSDKTKFTELAIKLHYDQLIQIAKAKYGENIPLIAMGHLFIQGALTSDSEREIHVGNLDGLNAEIISDGIDYMALGHIHKPQKVKNKNHVRYSGSPVFLDFSERQYEKSLLVLDIQNKNDIIIKTHKIPCYRLLLRFSGTLESVISQVDALENGYNLPAFVEVAVIEENPSEMKILQLEEWKARPNSGQYKIIKSKIAFINDQNNTFHSGAAEPLKSIDELTPLDIFKLKMDESSLDVATTNALIEAYTQLLEELNT